VKKKMTEHEMLAALSGRYFRYRYIRGKIELLKRKKGKVGYEQDKGGKGKFHL